MTFFLLSLFTALLYARPQDMIAFLRPIHMAEIVGICACVAYLGARLQGGFPFRRSTELRIMLALTVWFALGIPFSTWRGNSFEVFTQKWLKALVVFFLLTQALSSLSRIRKLIWIIGISIFIVCAVSLVVGRSELSDAAGRFMGISEGFLWGNTLGIALASMLPFMVALMLRGRSVLKSIFLISTLLAGVLLVLIAASRSGLLCILLSLALTWLVLLRHGFWARLAGVILAIGILVTLLVAPEIWWMRFRAIWDPASMTADSTIASAAQSQKRRQELLQRSIEFTFQNPALGLGMGNFVVASGKSVGQGYAWQATHNSYTEVSSEAGIPALFLFVGLFLYSGTQVRKVGRVVIRAPETFDLSIFSKAAFVSISVLLFGLTFASVSYEIALYYPVGISVSLQQLVGQSMIGRPEEAPESAAVPRAWG